MALTARRNISAQPPGTREARIFGLGDELPNLDAETEERLLALGAAERVQDGEAKDYESLTKKDLEDLAAERGVEVEGSGKDGDVVKQDLVDALSDNE